MDKITINITVSRLSWKNLRAEAKKRGIKTYGKQRRDVEEMLRKKLYN